MFGFSVSAHQDRGTSWVVIGAPEAKTNQWGVKRGGAVYLCPTDRDGGCRELPFDNSGNNVNPNGTQIDQKSGQWLGATVNSGGPDKPIVACAPRYVWYTSPHFQRRDPVGTCFVLSSDFRQSLEFSPCRTRHWGYHRQGTCQAGLGAAMSKDGDRLFIGAPGSWYWQGQMYSINPNARFPYTPPMFANYGAGQLYNQHIRNRPDVVFTKEGSPIDDDSYMGYSVTSGNFTGGKESGIAAGMPRGNRLVGKVVLYTWNLTNHHNISGSQLGAYFGYAVAAADVNGDGLDDLIVGSPLHTETNNEGKYEVGRIYVIYPKRAAANSNAKWPTMNTFVFRDGVYSKGRFGLSVAKLGDIDLDGYEDIAVGAPYAGDSERGAVYIYYGSSNGLHEKASQIIYSEDVSQEAMYTFGFSVAGGIDLDHNQYPDMVVGSYLSHAAFVLRSRPVIDVEASVLFEETRGIDLEEKKCPMGPKHVSCTTINACAKYGGIGVNDEISFIINFILDTKNPNDPRMFLYPTEKRSKFNETWILSRNEKKCRRIQVYVRESTRDKLTPIDVEMRYNLSTVYEVNKTTHRRRPNGYLHPVLNGNRPSVLKDSIVIKKECGTDDVCIPDLRVIATPNVDTYLSGSEERLEIDVIVQNEGEDSFETMFYISLPRGIDYFNTEKIEGPHDIAVQCAPSEVKNTTIKCDIGNPLAKGKIIHFKVLLDPFNMEGMSPSYDFYMEVNSTNPELNTTLMDNTKKLSVDIWVKTNLSLTGWAHTPDIYFKEAQYKAGNYSSETEIGPQIVHAYSIKNHGPSDINEALVLFLWPEETLAGDGLLYLMEQPETSSLLKCEFAHANALHVDLLPFKSYLEIMGLHEEKHASGIKSETAVQTNVGTSSTVFTHESEQNTNRNITGDSGDASDVHSQRGKESAKIDRNQGGVTGGSRVTETTYTHSWNSSSSNGGPVRTDSWSKNSTSFTGSDGVTHHSQSSTGTGAGAAGGSAGRNVQIHYTSTRGQENRFGEGATANVQSGPTYTVSHQVNQSGQHAGQAGHGHQESSHSSSSAGQHFSQSGQSSSTHSESRHTSHGQTSGGQHSSSGGHQFGQSGQHSTSGGHQFGQGGQHSTSGGHQFDQGGQHSTSGGQHSTSGGHQFGQSGQHSSSGGHQFGESGQHSSSGQIHGQSGSASSHREVNGQSSSGHHDSRHTGTGDTTLFNWNKVGGSQGQTGSGTKETSYESTYRQSTGGGAASGGEISDTGELIYHQGSTTHHRGGSQHQGSAGVSHSEGSASSGHVQGATSGHAQGATSQTHFSSSHHEGGSSGSHTQGSTGGSYHGATHLQQGGATGSGYRQVFTVTGQNLTGLISEEDLKNMLARGQGEFKNATHRIRWTTDKHNGGIVVQNGTSGFVRPFDVATEESVNENLDEYTRNIARGGSSYSRRGQGNQQSQGSRHQSGSSGRDRSTYGKYDQSNYDASLGIGAAAVGSGFRTTVLEAGPILTVDEDVSVQIDETFGRDNAGQYDNRGNAHYDPDLGTYETRNSDAGRAHGRVSYGSSRAYSGEVGGSSRSGSGHESRSHNTHSASGGTGGSGGQGEQHYESHSSSHRSYSSGQSGTRHFVGDNVATESDVDHRNRHFRHRREVDDDMRENIPCNAARCKYLRCVTGPLVKDEEVHAILRFRANAETVKRIGGSQQLALSSMMVSRINKLPYIGTPTERPIHSHEVFTNVQKTDTEIKTDIVPLWVVVLSACAGTIILLLLVFLLYKCGFFKRNRPSDAPERQPLNRNGHYPGDEQL
ncbi:inflated [Carabus blaptoides fortunei]